MFYTLNNEDIRNMVEDIIEECRISRKNPMDITESVVNNGLEKIKHYLMNYEDFALDYYAELFDLLGKQVKKHGAV